MLFTILRKLPVWEKPGRKMIQNQSDCRFFDHQYFGKELVDIKGGSI